MKQLGWILVSATWALGACNLELREKDEGLMAVDSSAAYAPAGGFGSDSLSADSIAAAEVPQVLPQPAPGQPIDTRGVRPEQVVAFAQSQMGVPYKYGATDPSIGFDCSGFITYVFNHFGIAVPRSSVDFTNVGKEVPEREARPGDLILFTGTDSAIRTVGHMGIVVAPATDTLKFIHATSGKAMSVTETPLGSYYRGRFVKTIRIFPD
jgi:cell wall-associated NlpC family hydrolase